MHELSIAEGIIAIIKDRTKNRVISIKLKIGEMSGVVPEALEFSFQITSKGTLADGAVLLIERVPVTARCDDCSEVFRVRDYCFSCARCGGNNFKVQTGRELSIEEIETVDNEGAA